MHQLVQDRNADITLGCQKIRPGTILFFAPLCHFLRCIALKRRHLYYDRTLGVLRSKHLPLGSNLLFSNILKVLQGEPGKQQYEE